MANYRHKTATNKYQLVASTIQMTVLLQYNRQDKFTVKELSKQVGCDCGKFTKMKNYLKFKKSNEKCLFRSQRS